MQAPNSSNRSVRSSYANRSIQLDGLSCETARRKLGLTREALAEQAQGPHPLSVTTIKRAERGEALYLNTAARLAELLRVPLEQLLSAPLRAEFSASVPAQRTRFPAIAVLPFRVQSPHDEYFAEGLVDDLITRLSRWWFPVIARGSVLGLPTTFTREVGTLLGADYLVEGNVQRAQGRVRVTVKLVCAATAQVLWADSYDRSLKDVFATQDELTVAIVSGVGEKVLDSEALRYADCDPSDLDAWDLALLGAWHYYRRKPQDNRTARELLERSLKMDVHAPLAWHTLVLTHVYDLMHQWADPKSSVIQVVRLSEEFERLYPNDARSHFAAAYADTYTGKRDSAMFRIKEAIALDPNLVTAYSLYGQTLNATNEPDRALEQCEVALRLCPRDPGQRWNVFFAMALAHFTAERYEEAIATLQQATSTSPTFALSYGFIASAQAHLGNLTEAREALATMKRLAPQMSVSGYTTLASFYNSDISARIIDGLKRAGFFNVIPSG